jgi:hypothetical protein
VTGDAAPIGREEGQRLAELWRPRDTTGDLHEIADNLLDEVEFQQSRWTGVPLDPSPKSYRDQTLAWAVAHFRARPREPDWSRFSSDSDVVAALALAAFRDLFGGWEHHPLFGAMVRTAAAQGFSLHAMAMFGTAKALVLAGNRVAFQMADGPSPTVASLSLVLGGGEQLSVCLSRFDRFEFPRPAVATVQTVRDEAAEAMISVRGRINRPRPGILVLSSGAVRASFEQALPLGIAAALDRHGKRHRGLAAVAGIVPKLSLTGKPREARFGHTFYPVPNRNHSGGDSVRIGSRGDDAGSPSPR